MDTRTRPIQIFLNREELDRLVKIGKHYNLSNVKRPGPKSDLAVPVSDTVRLTMLVTEWLIKAEIPLPEAVIGQ